MIRPTSPWYAILVMVTLLGGASRAAPSDPTPAAVVEGRLQHGDSDTHLHVPDGWFARQETTADGAALFVSKQDIAAQGSFSTGFSLNWFPRFAASKRIRPSDYAAAFAKQIATSQPHAELGSLEISPGVVVHEARYNIDSNGAEFKFIYLAVGDDRNDTLRLAWYEAPEATWDADWVHGERILHDFLRGVVRATSN